MFCPILCFVLGPSCSWVAFAAAFTKERRVIKRKKRVCAHTGGGTGKWFTLSTAVGALRGFIHAPSRTTADVSTTQALANTAVAAGTHPFPFYFIADRLSTAAARRPRKQNIHRQTLLSVSFPPRAEIIARMHPAPHLLYLYCCCFESPFQFVSTSRGKRETTRLAEPLVSPIPKTRFNFSSIQITSEVLLLSPV